MEPIVGLVRPMSMETDDLAEVLHDAYVASLGEGVRDDVGDRRIVRAIVAASQPPKPKD